MSNFIREVLQILRKFAYHRRLKRKITNPGWRSKLAELGFSDQEVEQIGEGWIRLRNIELELPPTDVAMNLLGAIPLLKNLRRCNELTIRWDSDIGELLVQHQKEKYPVNVYEELFILEEIFHQGDYELYPSDAALLFDIGANVGFASIYFAGRLPDTKIFAYEPHPKNYKRALRNIDLNRHVTDQISIKPYGLFDHAASMVMQSESGLPGRSSIVMNRAKEALSVIESVEIEVREAAQELESVIDLYPDRVVWVKMDCEGSEFTILRNLVERSVVNKIKGFVFEWHRVTDDLDIVKDLQAILGPAKFNLYLRGAYVEKAQGGIAVAVS